MPLTMENSGAALVAGAAVPAGMRLVRVLRPFRVAGEEVSSGVVPVPLDLASILIAANKAEPVAALEVPPAPPAAKTARKKD